MLIAIPKELFESDKIKGTEKLLLLAMCRFKEKGESEIVVTYQDLSDITGLTKPTVVRNILNMERDGLLKSKYIKNKHGRPMKMYTIDPEVTGNFVDAGKRLCKKSAIERSSSE